MASHSSDDTRDAFLHDPYYLSFANEASNNIPNDSGARLYKPPSADSMPQQLFPLDRRSTRPWPRFIRQSFDNEFLIYTDGACINNGRNNPAAGWGFIFQKPEPGLPWSGSMGGRLENCGPTGVYHPQTSNRAELRAVIAALQFRAWYGEGWTKMVFATDSEYVTKGATEWVIEWESNGWRKRQGHAVKNRDLWELLMEEIRWYRRQGLEIFFWRIPRAWNMEADEAAKRGATFEAEESFVHEAGWN